MPRGDLPLPGARLRRALPRPRSRAVRPSGCGSPRQQRQRGQRTGRLDIVILAAMTTVPGATKISRNTQNATPPHARHAEPPAASSASGSLAWAQRRTTAMSRSEASAYNALGKTHAVTQRGHIFRKSAYFQEKHRAMEVAAEHGPRSGTG